MTNREDRLAQIRRRGEEMKRKHKKRQLGILLTCVPLVLCVALYAGLVLPAMTSAGAAPESVGEALGQVLDGSAFFYTTGIEVRTPEKTWSVEDPAQILHCLEDTAFVYEFSSAQSAAGSTVSSIKTPTEENKKEERLVLTLLLQDGTQQRYLLSETSLTEEQTGKQHAIAKVQYEYLRMLLEQEEKDVVE